MRFGKYLESNRIEEHKYYYIDYSKLEKTLKQLPFNENEEHGFIKELEEEMKRVFDFISVKQGEFTRRSKELEKDAKDMYKTGSMAMESEKEELNRQVGLLQDEIKKLSEFIRINIVGFNKILRRHDNATNFLLKRMYKPKMKYKIDSLETLDGLLYRMSKIVLMSTDFDFSQKQSNREFIRNTDKYWVHKENLIPLKCMILKHLPIYVHTEEDWNLCTNSSGINSSRMPKPVDSPYHDWDTKKHDTCVSSVYFDNSNFDLYKGRLRKDQGAEAIRIRWYTSKVTEIVYIERKRHQESWTGLESKKLRFKIRERDVNDYINGKNVWKEVEKLNYSGVEDAHVLYNEIQNFIMEKKLRPVVRTFYKRTAFQMPNSAKVRISLDSNLCMIKECSNFDSPVKNWRREDVMCEFPFYNLQKHEIVRFPYTILEIKLQSVDERKPRWIEELQEGPLVEHVHKFSKFIHGCSILYPQIVDIPYWLPQMENDIRKDSFNSKPQIRSFKDGVLVDFPAEGKQMLPNEDTPLSDSSKMVEIDCEDKRIAIPVRIEPKVFFANERTFLSWLHFSIFIGGIGTAMLGLGDQKAVWSGVVFILTSIMFALYALYLYFWRAGMIRIRDPGPYDDLYGPAVLVAVFLIAMVLSMLFKFPIH